VNIFLLCSNLSLPHAVVIVVVAQAAHLALSTVGALVVRGTRFLHAISRNHLVARHAEAIGNRIGKGGTAALPRVHGAQWVAGLDFHARIALAAIAPLAHTIVHVVVTVATANASRVGRALVVVVAPILDAISRHDLFVRVARITAVVALFLVPLHQTTTSHLANVLDAQLGGQVFMALQKTTGAVHKEWAGMRLGVFETSILATSELEHATLRSVQVDDSTTVVAKHGLAIVEDNVLGIAVHVVGQNRLIVFGSGNVGGLEHAQQVLGLAHDQTGIEVHVVHGIGTTAQALLSNALHEIFPRQRHFIAIPQAVGFPRSARTLVAVASVVKVVAGLHIRESTDTALRFGRNDNGPWVLKRDGGKRVAKALDRRGGRGRIARGGLIDQNIARVRQDHEIVAGHVLEHGQDGGIFGTKAIKVRAKTHQGGGHSRQRARLFNQMGGGRVGTGFGFVDQNLNGRLLCGRLRYSKELRLHNETKQEEETLAKRESVCCSVCCISCRRDKSTYMRHRGDDGKRGNNKLHDCAKSVYRQARSGCLSLCCKVDIVW
jgi:hypothetical protein